MPINSLIEKKEPGAKINFTRVFRVADNRWESNRAGCAECTQSPFAAVKVFQEEKDVRWWPPRCPPVAPQPTAMWECLKNDVRNNSVMTGITI